MKTFSAIVGGFAMMANAQQGFFHEVTDKIKEKESLIWNSVKNRFGNMETKIVHDTENFLFEKNIVLGGDNNHFYFDYDMQTNHLKQMTSYLKNEKQFKQLKDTAPSCHTNRTP